MPRCSNCDVCSFVKRVKFYEDVCKFLCKDCRKKFRKKKR